MDSSLLSSYHSGKWIVLQGWVIDSSILPDIFSTVPKYLVFMQRKK